MREQVTLIVCANKHYLVSDATNWKEGLAYDTDRKEIIYYNGDYGEIRPATLRKVVAQPEEIGYVETGRRVVKENGYPVDYHIIYKEIKTEDLNEILTNGGDCFIQMKTCDNCVFVQGGGYSPDCCHDYTIEYLSNKVIIHRNNEELRYTIS